MSSNGLKLPLTDLYMDDILVRYLPTYAMEGMSCVVIGKYSVVRYDSIQRGR